MDPARIAAFVRHFPENGLKLLLEHPGNVRDLLRIFRYRHIARIDFTHMTVEPATFIARDFRHIEADLLLTAPFRAGPTARSRKLITLYLLLEHQSEPDLLIVFRVLDYLLQVYKTQLRAWGETHLTNTGFRFHPVLPIVFYTGLRRWDCLPSFADLTEAGALFEAVLPGVSPVFLDLSAMTDDRLKRDGGPFGQVLRLVRQREASAAELRLLLVEALHRLERMPRAERLRWLELLTYLDAFVYHYREPAEQPGLREAILDSVRTDELRQEFNTMRRTMADVHREEGIVLGVRRTLLRQLRKRFRNLPDDVVARIEAEPDPAQLDTWAENLIGAKRLEEIGIR